MSSLQLTTMGDVWSKSRELHSFTHYCMLRGSIAERVESQIQMYPTVSNWGL